MAAKLSDKTIVGIGEETVRFAGHSVESPTGDVILGAAFSGGIPFWTGPREEGAFAFA